MELQLPILLTIINLSLNQIKLSHLILSVQALVICIVTTAFLHINATYLSYALIYVYVGAICVLFLYFMMLLQNKFEIHGTNSLLTFVSLIVIEISFFSISYVSSMWEINKHQGQGRPAEEKGNIINYVAEDLLLNPWLLTIVILLLLLGIILPIFLISQTQNIIMNFNVQIKNKIKPSIISLKFGRVVINHIITRQYSTRQYSTSKPTKIESSKRFYEKYFDVLTIYYNSMVTFQIKTSQKKINTFKDIGIFKVVFFWIGYCSKYFVFVTTYIIWNNIYSVKYFKYVINKKSKRDSIIFILTWLSFINEKIIYVHERIDFLKNANYLNIKIPFYRCNLTNAEDIAVDIYRCELFLSILETIKNFLLSELIKIDNDVLSHIDNMPQYWQNKNMFVHSLLNKEYSTNYIEFNEIIRQDFYLINYLDPYPWVKSYNLLFFNGLIYFYHLLHNITLNFGKIFNLKLNIFLRAPREDLIGFKNKIIDSNNKLLSCILLSINNSKYFFFYLRLTRYACRCIEIGNDNIEIIQRHIDNRDNMDNKTKINEIISKSSFSVLSLIYIIVDTTIFFGIGIILIIFIKGILQYIHINSLWKDLFRYLFLSFYLLFIILCLFFSFASFWDSGFWYSKNKIYDLLDYFWVWTLLAPIILFFGKLIVFGFIRLIKFLLFGFIRLIKFLLKKIKHRFSNFLFKHMDGFLLSITYICYIIMLFYGMSQDTGVHLTALDYMDKPKPTYERLGVFENYACYHTLTNANFRNYSTSTKDKEFYLTLAKYASDHARKVHSLVPERSLPLIEAYFEPISSFKSRTPVLNLEKMKKDFPMESNSELTIMYEALESSKVSRERYLKDYCEAMLDQVRKNMDSIIMQKAYSLSARHAYPNYPKYVDDIDKSNFIFIEEGISKVDEENDSYGDFGKGYIVAHYISHVAGRPNLEEYTTKNLYEIEIYLKRFNDSLISRLIFPSDSTDKLKEDLFDKIIDLTSFFIDNPGRAGLFYEKLEFGKLDQLDNSCILFVNTPRQRCRWTYDFYWFCCLRETEEDIFTGQFISGFNSYFRNSWSTRYQLREFRRFGTLEALKPWWHMLFY